MKRMEWLWLLAAVVVLVIGCNQLVGTQGSEARLAQVEASSATAECAPCAVEATPPPGDVVSADTTDWQQIERKVDALLADEGLDPEAVAEGGM